MSTAHEPAIHAPTSSKGGQTPTSSDTQNAANLRQQFAVFALTMSWQLALVVLVPIIGGVELDKAMGKTNVFVFVGLAIAVVGSGVVLWRTMHAANRLPVPKLTEAQKRAVQKSYEEEDNE